MHPCGFPAKTLLPLVLLLLAPSAGSAQGRLQAGPTLVEIRAGSTATRLLLRNTGDAPVSAQIRAFAWSQTETEERLLANDQIVVSPPIVEVPPGVEQVVRVVLVGPPPTDRDLSYRIVVDELPQTTNSSNSMVKIRMRYVLPLFVRSPSAIDADLSCTVDAGLQQLACENSGGRAAQLGASRLIDENGQSVVLSTGLFGYVLASSRRIWPLPPERPQLTGATLRLETRFDGEPAEVPVTRVP